MFALRLVCVVGILGLGACATAQASPSTSALVPAALSTQAATGSSSSTVITPQELQAAQRAWGDALVRISSDYEAGGIERARATANSVLDSAYGYNLGPVLFKPTLTVAPQTFRTTKAGALAYFVGGDSSFPNDKGFALNGWRSVSSEIAASFIDGDVAMTTGNVRLTDKTGAVTVVDKTWGYKKGPDGTLRIVLHHSSLPYQPK
jgi:hypothetical protein